MESRGPRLRTLSSVHPVPVALGLVVAWMAVAGLGAGAWSAVTAVPLADGGPQLAGRCAGSAFVLVLLWRAHWLLEAGVTSAGPAREWAVALVAIACLVPAYLVALFGVGSLRLLPGELAAAFPQTWVTQASVGIAEELLFRGLVLVVLAAAWGRRGRGGVGVMIVAGLLFGVPHLVVLVGGIDPAVGVLNAVAAVVSGAWYAAIVLAYGSIWPLVVVHASTNLAVLVMPLSADAGGYLRLVAVEAPWLAFGLWLTLHHHGRTAGSHHQGTHRRPDQPDATRAR